MGRMRGDGKSGWLVLADRAERGAGGNGKGSTLIGIEGKQAAITGYRMTKI